MIFLCEHTIRNVKSNLHFRKEQSTLSNFRSSLTTKLPSVDLKTYVMELFKGNRNRIKNSKANNMTFDIHILLVLTKTNHETTYCGKTFRHFKVTVCDPTDISPLTNKRSKSKKSTVVKDHMLVCNQPVSFEYFKVLASSNS